VNGKRKPAAPGDSVLADSAPVKLSVNVSGETGRRLRKVAFEERLSESSIVEIALTMLFTRTSDANLGKYLRERGASLRRGSRQF
jgi:hypothetical protein